ncbi:MAG: PAS domain-containing sensor histidine kinase [Planctomycetota bacterium]|jgi:two-component system sensor histidine kinase UhpB
MRDMVGYTEPELMQMTVQDLHPQDTLEDGLAQFQAHAEGRTSRTVTIPCVRKDGVTIDVNINTAQAVIDGQPCLVGFFTNVTERATAARALEESEKRYRQLVESVNEGIVATDTKGRITFINTAATEIIGQSAEALLGSDFFGSTTRSQRNGFRRTFLDPHEPSEDLLVKFLREDQKLVYLRMQSSPILDDAGEHVGALVVINDITQRRQAEESLKAAHRRLMAAGERERRELAREMHDSLGQQAIAMRLAVEGLLSNSGSGREHQAGLESLSKSCQTLTEEIRAVCYGLYPAALEALGLYAAMKQLAEECNPAIATTVTCAQCLKELRAPADVEIALFRIAQEATTNAIRHSRGTELRIDLARQGGELILTVADNGIGFDVRHTETTGLGLRTIRERASAIEGSLTITSSQKGTQILARAPTVLEEPSGEAETP